MENKKEDGIEWHLVYKEIRELLYEYFGNCNTNNKQPNEQLYQDLIKDKEFVAENQWILNNNESNPAGGVDPINVFASINSNKLDRYSRVIRINILLRLLGSKSVYQKIDFSGCPLQETSLLEDFRNPESQNQIWGLFINVVNNGTTGLEDKFSEKLYNWYGINIESMSYFLYWVDSDNYLLLDKFTLSFMLGANILPESPKNYNEYFTACKLEQGKSIFRELTRVAYESSSKNIKEIIYSKEFDYFLDRFNTKKKRDDAITSIFQNFKVVAIRPTKKQKHLNNLKINQLYPFYKNSKFSKNDVDITFSEGVEESMYRTNGIDISISCIVGKNASGKSTISELLFLAINAISQKKLNTSKVKFVTEEVFVDLFVKTDTLYKISITTADNEHQFNVIKYTFEVDTNKYIEPKELAIEKFDLNNFFYTVAINYSLYGLNSNIIGKWIDPLFHKNDSYQVPIVLNPKRTKGDVEINIENSLAISRLLSNLLDPSTIDFQKEIIPDLLENKTPEKLKISFDFEKMERVREKYNGPAIETEEIIEEIDVVLEELKIDIKEGNVFEDQIKEYLYYKLIGIGIKYPEIYSSYVEIDEKEKFLSFNDIEGFVKAVLEDESHISFKVKQAINYLRFNYIDFDVKGKSNPRVIDVSKEIRKNRAELFDLIEIEEKKEAKIIELIPPSIFKVEIEFKNGSQFKRLSSGEKQKIYAINTVGYHIFNINSVMSNTDLVKYRYINVLFDEVELYFHPDMQRTFLSDLLKYLNQISLGSIAAINFQFITHSPFILSDIPNSNILRLDLNENEESIPQENHSETFGANIHDLLANDFFLRDGFMGEFARSKIEDLIKYLSGEETKQEWSNDLAKKIISVVGEPYLKSDLLDLYNSKMFHNTEDIDLEIERLSKRKIELKNDIN